MRHVSILLHANSGLRPLLMHLVLHEDSLGRACLGIAIIEELVPVSVHPILQVLLLGCGGRLHSICHHLHRIVVGSLLMTHLVDQDVSIVGALTLVFLLTMGTARIRDPCLWLSVT